MIYAITSLWTEKRNTTKNIEESRLSILLWIVSLVQRAIFSILLFFFAWIKYIMKRIGRKRTSKKCALTQFALEPDRSLRREEIQDRSSLMIDQTNPFQQPEPYLENGRSQQHHYITTIIMKPAAHTISITDDADEIGTCVESIVPDTHYPSESDGKFSTWKIVPAPTAISSLSSPSSTSFGVLK